MPPLAATLAATLALRAGISLVRAARERRVSVDRERDRRIGLYPQEEVAEGLQRMAVGQLDLAIETLERLDGEGPAERGVHETRKALKRLRAVLRLLAAELGDEVYVREDAALRNAGRRLSGSRDAEVLLATLEGLIESHPDKLAGRGGVARLRAHQRSERDRAWRATLADSAARALTLEELRACRARVAAWQLAQRDGVGLALPGFTRVYRQGRKRFRRAARRRGEPTLVLHRWRKRVKDLRYAAEALQWRADDAQNRVKPKGRRARRACARARKQGAWLRRLARRADDLGELLGQEHDLAVLAGYVRTLGAGAAPTPRVGARTRRRILKLIAARRRKLRKRALSDGERLYRPAPARLASRLASAHPRARPPLR
ncbi:MAG TPA: CHAD domain-containing protein [Solirubrobacteraceae bacterium]|nr:CHAD domain-containing protein [Solirubrobacteraceae bacterium]